MKLRISSYFRVFLIAVFTLLLTACSNTELVQDITQKQAHEIVSLLSSRGISSHAEKQTGAGDKYTVTVKERHYTAAVDLITKHNLPGKPREVFADLVQQKGLMPNSRDMEKLRLDHALAVQLEEVLSQLPEVDEVKAIVRYHFKFGDKAAAPGASLLITLLPSKRENDALQQEIQELVTSSLPALTPEQVHLTFQSNRDSLPQSDAEEIGILNDNGKIVRIPLTTFLFGWYVSEEDHNILSLFFALFLVFTACVGALIGYWVAFLRGGGGDSVRDYELPNIRTNVLKIGNSTDTDYDERT